MPDYKKITQPMRADDNRSDQRTLETQSASRAGEATASEAAALSTAATQVAAEVTPQEFDGPDVQNRLAVSLASAGPRFHAPFSLN